MYVNFGAAPAICSGRSPSHAGLDGRFDRDARSNSTSLPHCDNHQPARPHNMRLRLRVQRNELPAVNTLWPITDVQQKHTVAQLLEAINQTFPLETDKWGLEDYVVTVASYECLHYHEIGAVCKDEDEVVVRPLSYAEVRARTLMGRSQISGDGRKLEDGIAFGRPLLRAPVRPEVRIPARKRKRGGEDDADDEEDKRVRFSTHVEASDQTEGALLPSHKTVVVVSGRGDEEEDDDEEEEDEDFELEDDASSSEADPDSSEASSSSSESDSSDSTASSDSSDSSSDSSSDESSEASVKAAAKPGSRANKPTPKAKATLSTGTTNTPQQTNSGAPQPGAIPYEGKRKTQERNARRRDSKKLAFLKENNILPPNADLLTLRAWEKTADWTTEAPGLTKHMNATETSSSTLKGSGSNSTEDLDEEVDLATRRQQLLESIASGGVEISNNGKAVREEDADEGPEVQSNRIAAENAELTERLYRENINSMIGEPTTSAGAINRRGLDLSSAERLLYGSLGVRAPKTQEQKDALQKRLAAREGTAAPKSKNNKKPKQPEAVEDDAQEEDPDAWMQRIDLRAVECCDEGVELSTPPFPFYQRWDQQYRKKKNRNMATYAHAPRKRRRGNQDNMVGELVESYDKYNQDGYGDILDYDGDGAGDDVWDQDDLAEQQLLNEVNADLPTDDFPPLPENVSSLATLANDDARSGDYITYTELVCSPATSWQPLMMTRTVQLVEKDGDDWKVKVALRDLPPKEYDGDGNRVYGKFEMEEMSDDEDDAQDDERIKVMAFAELADARLLQRLEEEVATAAGVDAEAE
jgi:hypothetical protein